MPLSNIETTYADIEYRTITTNDAAMELGNERTTQDGKNGVSFTKYEVKQSLLDKLLGKPAERTKVETGVKEEPVVKKISQGTKRWQYMHCSDGTYRYFTDKQMQDKQTGFTSKSPDACQQSSHGTKVSLSDTPPAQRSAYTPPSSYSYNSYSSGNSFNYEVEPYDTEPLEYNPPELKDYDVGPTPPITSSPVNPTTPQNCYYYEGNGWCN